MISPNELPSLPLLECENLPSIAAVYFVMNEAEIYYIGQSKNIKQRFSNHEVMKEIKDKTGIKVAWLKCCISNLRGIEKAAITSFMPKLNRAFPSGVKANRDAQEEVRDKRIRLPLLGDYYYDLLLLDAWANDRTKSEQAKVLCCERLEERRALIEEAIAQAARKRGITPDEVRAKILAGEEI